MVIARDHYDSTIGIDYFTLQRVYYGVILIKSYYFYFFLSPKQKTTSFVDNKIL